MTRDPSQHEELERRRKYAQGELPSRSVGLSLATAMMAMALTTLGGVIVPMILAGSLFAWPAAGAFLAVPAGFGFVAVWMSAAATRRTMEWIKRAHVFALACSASVIAVPGILVMADPGTAGSQLSSGWACGGACAGSFWVFIGVMLAGVYGYSAPRAWRRLHELELEMAAAGHPLPDAATLDEESHAHAQQ